MSSRSIAATRCTAIILTSLPLFTGCASPAPPFTETITTALPRVEALPKTSETQTKGGISITLVAESFELGSIERCVYEPSSTVVIGLPRGVSSETHSLWHEARYEAPLVTPDEFELILTIRNSLERVFRGAGALVQMSVDGRTQAMEQSQYLDFLETLIPPRGEQQVRIRGPRISALDRGTVGVFIYDVVTATDEAGNVLERQNFEWYFDLSKDPVSESVTVPRRHVWLANRDARDITPDGRLCYPSVAGPGGI